MNIADWFMTHGIRILVLVLIAVVIYFILRHSVPLLIKKFVSQRMKGQLEEEIKQRTDTLSSVLVTTGAIIIALITIFTILPEFGVNITAALAGLGIAGIAIAFGTQSLIRDIIAGIFILLEDQYGVGDVVKIAGIAGLVVEVG